MTASGGSRRPSGVGLGAEAPKRRATDQVTLGVESVVDGGVSGEKTLGGGGTLEALHPSLALSDWQVRVLHPAVLAQATGKMEVAALQILQRRGIGPETVGRYPFRFDGPPA